MTQKETTNAIIRLRQLGWTDTEITDFLVFMETHIPTSDEAEEAKSKQK